MKEYRGAIDTLNLAEMTFGMNEPIILKRAKVRNAIKEFHHMEEDLRQVLKINESNLEAITMLRDYYIMQKDWEKAYEMQQRLKRYVRTEEEEKRLLGIRYERQEAILNEGTNIDYELVIKELKDIIGVDKRFVPAYILLEEVYRRMEKLNEAGRVLGRGYTKTGHIIFLLKMEDLYIERGEPGVILKIYRRVLDISTKDYLVSFLYARLCLRLQMIDEAIETLNMLLMEGVDFKGLHKAMAEAYIHKGETERAIEEFRKAFPPEHVYIPFVCSRCQAKKAEWSEFCGSCNNWDTINVRKEDFVQTESSELKMFYEAGGWTD
jgi:lipopolysaccharide biosynthesis regulator YciM